MKLFCILGNHDWYGIAEPEQERFVWFYHIYHYHTALGQKVKCRRCSKERIRIIDGIRECNPILPVEAF